MFAFLCRINQSINPYINQSNNNQSINQSIERSNKRIEKFSEKVFFSAAVLVYLFRLSLPSRCAIACRIYFAYTPAGLRYSTLWIICRSISGPVAAPRCNRTSPHPRPIEISDFLEWRPGLFCHGSFKRKRKRPGFPNKTTNGVALMRGIVAIISRTCLSWGYLWTQVRSRGIHWSAFCAVHTRPVQVDGNAGWNPPLWRENEKNQHDSKSINQSIDQLITHSLTHSLTQSIHRSVNQAIKQTKPHITYLQLPCKKRVGWNCEAF